MAGTAGTYELGRFSGECASSRTPIFPRQEFIAALVDGLDDEGHPVLRRLDFASDIWQSGVRPDGLVSFWKSVAPEPGEKRQMFVDDETLLEMVQRTSEESDVRRRAFRWILALVLLRRKALKLVDGIIHEGENEFWAFRPRGADPSSEPFRIQNPRIREEELRELADQLGDIIRADA